MSAAEKEAPGGSGPAAQSNHDQVIVPADTTPGKRLANLQAKAALLGCELHLMADGSLMLSRWNLTRALPDLDAVEVALAQMGGRP